MLAGYIQKARKSFERYFAVAQRRVGVELSLEEVVDRCSM